MQSQKKTQPTHSFTRSEKRKKKELRRSRKEKRSAEHGSSSEEKLVHLAFTTLLSDPQCRNLRNFLSLRFYVKSILENLEIPKLLFLPFKGEALNFGHLLNFSIIKRSKN